METVLDYNPTPSEVYRLGGYTSSEKAPITDKVRKKILRQGVHSQTLDLACLMLMRKDKARYLAYLHRLPADDGDRQALEECVSEWSWSWPWYASDRDPVTASSSS